MFTKYRRLLLILAGSGTISKNTLQTSFSESALMNTATRMLIRWLSDAVNLAIVKTDAVVHCTLPSKDANSMLCFGLFMPHGCGIGVVH